MSDHRKIRFWFASLFRFFLDFSSFAVVSDQETLAKWIFFERSRINKSIFFLIYETTFFLENSSIFFYSASVKLLIGCFWARTYFVGFRWILFRDGEILFFKTRRAIALFEGKGAVVLGIREVLRVSETITRTSLSTFLLFFRVYSCGSILFLSSFAGNLVKESI